MEALGAYSDRSERVSSGDRYAAKEHREMPTSGAAALSIGGQKKQAVNKRALAEYDYTDKDGALLYQIVRIGFSYADGSTDKSFRARRRPVGDEMPEADGWVYNMNGAGLTLYNLPAVDKAALVYIVEGEKDADRLRELGLTATCNPFGAGKWRPEYSELLRGKAAAIIPDNDHAGRKHAEIVANSLYGIADEIVLIDLPGLPDKGDVTDFIDLGGTVDDLMSLVERAESWVPPAKPSTAASASKFVFTPLSKLLEEPPEDVSFIWDLTLPSGGFSICSAKPKVGKSTLARNLAIAVATGQPFLGRETKQGKVLYLCLEEKRSEIRNHFERMGVASDQILVHTGSTPKDAMLELAAAMAEAKPVLVIIDPLSRVIRVTDFNDYGSMARGLEPLIDLARQTGCHILALHHDSKMERSGGDALLGSTALFGSVDCHIGLKKRDKGRTIATTQRYGEDMPETVIELDRATGLVSAMGDLQSFNQEAAKAAILGSIADNEALDETDIKGRIDGYSKGDLSKALRALVEDGKINRAGEGKRGHPYLYSKPTLWVN